MNNRYINILGLVIPLALVYKNTQAMDKLRSKAQEIIEQITDVKGIYDYNDEDTELLKPISREIKEMQPNLTSVDIRRIAEGLKELYQSIE